MDVSMQPSITRAATAQRWLLADPVLAEDEVGIESDTFKFKVGDGVKKWSELAYDPRSAGQFKECRPLLIGGVSTTEGTPPNDVYEPPTPGTPLVVDEKRLVLNGGADQTTVGDMDASFGGIVLKGFRDHFWLYDYANNAWNTSDNVNLSCETGLMIDNRKALDEQKVRCGSRTKGGMLYLGSGEHDSWRIGTNEHGDLIFEYRRLDGQWVEKGKMQLTDVDKGTVKGAPRAEADNPYIERAGQAAKKPTAHDPAKNLGNEFWPLFATPEGETKLKVKLFLNTDDAFALGRIMKRTVNFNGVIPGPVLKVKAGDVIEIDFYNEIDDLGELETWNDGMMQRDEMVHAHIDDRFYDKDAKISDDSTPEQDALNQQAVTWMSHVMMRGATNLHTHGFHVTPGGFGDNVTRSSKPGSRLRHRYKLPPNHFGGLQWYHPHGHGGSMNLITRGAMGLILIEGPYQKRLNDKKVEREFFVLQRIEWGDDLNGHDELNWVDYVSFLPLDMYDPTAKPMADGQQFTASEPTDLSPYYRDNLDPKCVCACAALEGAPEPQGNPDHPHGNFSLATPECKAVQVRWVPAVNGQKKPVFTAKLGELKIFTMVNGSGITFFRIAVKEHHILVAGRDGIPQVTSETAPDAKGQPQPAPLTKPPIDPDFVRLPAGQRLKYVICNSGQRFEFFIIPDSKVKVMEGDYPIYMLPIAEKEIFTDGELAGADSKVQIATLRYCGTLEQSAPNHVSNLISLLPNVSVDDPGHDTDQAAFPVDRAEWQYIKDADQLKTLVPQITATVTGASLTLNGLTATVVMPKDGDGEPQPHHLEPVHEVRIQGKPYLIDSLDDDMATFHIAIDPDRPVTFPAPGLVDFEYNLYQIVTINNSSTGDAPREIVNVLTDHFYYRGIELKDEHIKKLENFIVRQRKMSFAIHKHGIAGQGSDTTFMNGSPFNDFNRTVGYKGTNEEILIENRSEVIHLFHIHINYFQVLGYKDASFGGNGVANPPTGDNAVYTFAKEIAVPFEGFEDTVTIPPGKPATDGVEADENSRGQVRVRITHEDYVGLFLMHCHLLDDQDMGMMQEVEVVAKGYKQAPFSQHSHSHLM